MHLQSRVFTIAIQARSIADSAACLLAVRLAVAVLVSMWNALISGSGGTLTESAWVLLEKAADFRVW